MSQEIASRSAERSSKRAVPLQPLLGIAIGLAVWMAPQVVRFALGKLELRQFVYSGFWAAAAIATSLGVISIVYSQLTRRDVGLQTACVLSLTASIPALMVFWVFDYVLTTRDPTLSPFAAERGTVQDVLAIALADSIALSAILAAIVFLPMFARAHEQRTHENADLSREAELLRYRAHLEPHFVLNSLNAVAGLIEDDPPQARELLAALGDLFRDAAAFHATHQVRDEFAWLQRYVTIHQLRYPDKLSPDWSLTPEAQELTMPALLLQPLLENAVKHGALRGQGYVGVAARVAGGKLELTVSDDGPRLGAPRVGGRGLSIVRRRLAIEGLDDGAFELVREGSHTVARVRLPLRHGEGHG